MALSCSIAFAEDDIPLSMVSPYYLSIFGGVGFLEDSNVSLSPLSVGFSRDGDHIEFDNGSIVGGALGWKFAPGWRAEAELAFRRNSVSAYFEGTFSPPVSNGAQSGDAISAFSIMANAFRDIEVTENISLHVGGGIGMALLELNLANTDYQFGSVSAPVNDTIWSLASQLGAGIDWKLGNGWVAFVDYRAFAARDTTFSGTHSSSGRSFNFDMDYFHQAVIFGIKLPLGG